MNLTLLLHVLSIVVWVGGMFFAYMALRPVAASVLEDNAEGFAYLPGRDLAILRQWLHRPYSF